ncbi:annexin D3-like isoform X1 [Nicotiana sylvestris]|uniref:Annexin n=1 Tax=Nicotiana sylvestris TaxID=4096 RepID=A0A1U7W925_NICSY|nr:PREDICTED: annexin D3-like isoform X1 [Nicotiana sylvestris]XP_016503721.1 PREDICTED: annexin D3-like isoform X1 [Nicotiana tabacum]
MGTLRIPDVIPSPTEDCESLMKAFKGRKGLATGCSMYIKGLGTNEKSVISVLGHRNASQRKKIRETYEQLYNRSLVDDIFAELSGDFRKAVILWTYEPSERDARLANEALKSRKKTITQLQVIVEIACASSPDHLAAVRQEYCGLFNCSLEEDITANVPMPVQKILIGLVRSYRYDKELVDPSTANAEAAILREAIRTKQLDHDNFLMILSTRNVHQLRATFECYKQNYGFSIDQDIKSCGKGLLESILKVVIWCIDTPEKHFAEVVRASIVGIGTDEDSLTRAIVTRAEVDMMKVRGEYFIANKTSLDNAVIGDTSGDYRKFLMTLLGAKV